MDGHVGSAPTIPVWKTGVYLSTLMPDEMESRAGVAPTYAVLQTAAWLLGQRDNCSELKLGASRRCCPGAAFLQRKPAGCRQEAKWSQSPVLPWAQWAYETRLSAGSTATLPDEEEWGPHPELHRVPLPTEQAHRSKCFGGAKIGRRETTCTSKAA